MLISWGNVISAMSGSKCLYQRHPLDRIPEHRFAFQKTPLCGRLQRRRGLTGCAQGVIEKCLKTATTEQTQIKKKTLTIDKVTTSSSPSFRLHDVGEAPLAASLQKTRPRSSSGVIRTNLEPREGFQACGT